MQYNRFLLIVAGLGGLLYGIDVGIIAGALPYLTATSGFSPGQLSFVVAAVLLGSVISTLFAGLLADWLGRKWLMTATGLMFCISVPLIALSHGFLALVGGRLLQGMSGGLIGVVIPLYLAECLTARDRGKGTGVFQWLLVFGFVVSGLITLYFSHELAQIVKIGTALDVFAFKARAWRDTFWISLPFGLLFTAGTLALSESPRWLFRRNKPEAALAALRRSRDEEAAGVELREMEETARQSAPAAGPGIRESLLRRKYVIPFVIACVILTCNQLTGINSIIPYNTTILLQAGLDDYWAHFGTTIFTLVNFFLTLLGVILVDRAGRKFLLSTGTAGIILSLVCTGLLFHHTEATNVDVSVSLRPMIKSNQTLSLTFDQTTADRLLRSVGASSNGRPQSMVVNYAYGDFNFVTNPVRSDDVSGPITIKREIPGTRIEAVLGSGSPLGDLRAAHTAPLRIVSAYVTPVPSASNGWLVALTLYLFMGFYAVGPGVVVWLALSELMPTRIRSNGMSIALVLNQATSTTIAAIFLPTVARHGYASMFFAFAAFTLVYFGTAAFFLPETKGKTLEEIEEHFELGVDYA
jgi:MFS transporter, SP family, solute carrier family 2 (myo-inositol transporter), member 13